MPDNPNLLFNFNYWCCSSPLLRKQSNEATRGIREQGNILGRSLLSSLPLSIESRAYCNKSITLLQRQNLYEKTFDTMDGNDSYELDYEIEEDDAKLPFKSAHDAMESGKQQSLSASTTASASKPAAVKNNNTDTSSKASSKRSLSSRVEEDSSSSYRSDAKMPAKPAATAVAKGDSSEEVRPGVTYVRNRDDTRASQKEARSRAIGSSSTQAVRPGSFTAVSAADDRVARKTRNSTASQKSSSAAATPAVRPGSFTAVSSADDRISRKIRGESSRSISNAAASATAFYKSVDEQEQRNMDDDDDEDSDDHNDTPPPRPGSFTAVSNTRNSKINRKLSSSSSSSFRPGTATAVRDADDRIARKNRAESSFRSSSRSIGAAAGVASAPRVGAFPEKHDSRISKKQQSGGGAAAQRAAVGAMAVSGIDERIAAKQASGGKSSSPSLDIKPGAVATKNDEMVQRKVSGSGGKAIAVGAQASSEMDERIRRKRVSNGLEKEDDRKTKNPQLRPGSFACTGDDPARSKTSYVDNELFQDEEGELIDEDKYMEDIIQQVAEPEKEKDKQMTAAIHNAMKEASPDAELKPGAYSVRAPAWSFFRGARESISMSRRAKFGTKRARSGLNNAVTDTGIEDNMGDFIDEELSWWEALNIGTICVGCCIIAIVLVGVLIPVLKLNGDEDEPINAGPYEKVLFPLSGKDSFKDTTSPQSLAFDWIVYTDKLPIDSPNLIQRYSLMVMYFSNKGGDWIVHQTQWGSSDHECNWDYIECSVCSKENLNVVGSTSQALGTGGRLRHRSLENVFALPGKDGTQCVSSLIFDKAYLKGELVLPDELSQLEYLYKFDVAENNLSGKIPDNLYSLSTLQHIYLERNQFTGMISSNIGNLNKLKVFSVFQNTLTGQLPETMKTLESLEILWTSRNIGIGGPLSEFIASWPNLVEIDVSNCAFQGSIPEEIESLSNLKGLYLYDNKLSGSLPTELGLLTTLSRFVISRNRSMTGSIPSELGALRNVEELRIDSIDLDGSIPTELGNLSRAVIINLAENNLIGNLPSELGRCSSATELSLFNNQLEGTVPSELGKLSQLATLYLQRNNLTGEVPGQVCSLRDELLETFITSCSDGDLECPTPDCCTSCTF